MENSSPNKSSLPPFRIQTQDTAFDLLPGQNLLDALEQTGHDVSYQCRHGYCGSCRVALLSGRVDYAEPPLAFLHEGEILPCCCRVKEDISIDSRLRRSEPDLFDYEQQLFADTDAGDTA